MNSRSATVELSVSSPSQLCRPTADCRRSPRRQFAAAANPRSRYCEYSSFTASMNNRSKSHQDAASPPALCLFRSALDQQTGALQITRTPLESSLRSARSLQSFPATHPTREMDHRISDRHPDLQSLARATGASRDLEKPSNLRIRDRTRCSAAYASISASKDHSE